MAARLTIAKEVALEGTGLHEGLPARLRLRPAPAGAGVRFRRTDVAGSEPVPVHISTRVEQPRRTAVALGPAEVHTVEHFMAAANGLGVTDIEVEIDRVEVPGFDGSARAFEEALRSAGIVETGAPAEVPVLRLDRTVEVADRSGARIVAVPCPGRLVLDYTLDYGQGLPRARVVVDVSPETFARELSPARTFCLESEAQALRAAGLGRGATTGNTLVIGKDGLPLENTLRFPDECARHKTLDLLGDLGLLGMRLEARVIAYKAGHSLNAALVRELWQIASSAVAPGPNAAQNFSVSHEIVTNATLTAQEAFPDRYEAPAVAFDGHFPGDPVLPGIASLAALRAGRDLAGVEGVKFRRIVRPGEALAIERRPLEDGRVRARATVGAEVAVDAVLVPARRAAGEP